MTAGMAVASSVQPLLDYLAASPSPYHAVANAAAMLLDAGFARLDERAAWTDLPPSGLVQRGGALVAWRSADGVSPSSGFRIVGAHSDYPNLRLKPHGTSFESNIRHGLDDPPAEAEAGAD